MTTTDLRLEYQKVTGDSLDTIDKLFQQQGFEFKCDDCGMKHGTAVLDNHPMAAYVEWLEEKITSCSRSYELIKEIVNAK